MHDLPVKTDPFDKEKRQRLVRVALGQEAADTVIVNAQIVDVLTREIYTADVALAGGRVAGVGSGYRAPELIDAHGAFLAPGFMDAHIHIESSLLTPARFAQAVRPHGTTGVVAEPHELVNVLGLHGLHWMLEAGRGSGLRVYASLPSCVPASEYERGGAVLTAQDIREGLAVPGVLGLAEMMNYPGVLGGDAGVWSVLEQAQGRRDGHAAGLRGAQVQAYAAAGIHSDHEAVTPQEALERLRAGLWLMVREGSAARNLDALLPVLRGDWSGGRPPRRAMLVSDDVSVDELLELGHLDRLMRTCVAGGLHPADALALVTCNPAEYWGLHDLGAVCPGYHADLVLLKDLQSFEVLDTWVGGQRGMTTAATPALPGGAVLLGAEWERASFEPPASWPVIGVRPEQIVTDALPSGSGDTRLVVSDRYGRGEVAACWAAGLHLERGAVALSVLHDAHHVIAAGADAGSIRAAGRALEALGGGAVVVDETGRVLAELPLPFAGLMTDAPPQAAAQQAEGIKAALHSLGCTLPYPITTLSFLGLTVIPSLKLTPRGLFDVEGWQLVGEAVVGDA
ncbi:adenine deaminase [Deinococcus ruber]|uniref:Adenine deaminase n=1 Tax=Deinococcus ruber TaxID=1848197 RepID=A0A918C295_9DEIO|nr:adenine deaminase C-terminal domain-containing protein [Deinococcus ruber]GGR02081.1 adenine deaminase [Deinococcus ruber]